MGGRDFQEENMDENISKPCCVFTGKRMTEAKAWQANWSPFKMLLNFTFVSKTTAL